MPTKFCNVLSTSAPGISQQHLNHPNSLASNVYQFYEYIHLRTILHHLGILLPHEDCFSELKSTYIKSACCSNCDDYGVNGDEIWMYGYWLYTAEYSNFANGEKDTQKSPSDNLTQ